MIVASHTVTDPCRCPYLSDQRNTMEHVVVRSMSALEYEQLLQSGWRKFGRLLYRPICDDCEECRSTRIHIPSFSPNRSQARCLNRNADLRIEVGQPKIDTPRMDIYRRYHVAREADRGWHRSDHSVDGYADAFLDNPTQSLELSVWLDDTLLGIALLDITGNIVSGVYHYHDPDYADRSLGKFMMLKVIRLGELMNRTWAHFGYHVAGCGSLRYKTTFRPVGILGRDGVWRLPDADGNYDPEGEEDHTAWVTFSSDEEADT